MMLEAGASQGLCGARGTLPGDIKIYACLQVTEKAPVHVHVANWLISVPTYPPPSARCPGGARSPRDLR